MGETRLDLLAREFAAGSVSRRSALKRLAGAAIAAAVPAGLMAEPALGRCPKSRRCGGKCCPRHSRCKQGKCKCNEGFLRCDGKCTECPPLNPECTGFICDPTCTAVGRSPGTACSGGVCDGSGNCVECLSPDDCPGTDTACHRLTCTNNTCGIDNEQGEPCSSTEVGCAPGEFQDICCNNGTCNTLCGGCS